MSETNQGQENTGAPGEATLVAQAAASAEATTTEAPANTGDNTTAATPEPPKVEGAPESYTDFTLPDTYKLDEGALTTFKELAKAKGMTQEEAQKTLDVFANHFKSQVDQNVAAFLETSKEWADQTRADKDFGGPKFAESQAAVGRVMERFADGEFVDILNASQLGNHPAVFRFLAKIGATISERPLDTSHGGDTSPSAKSVAEKLYPDLAARAA